MLINIMELLNQVKKFLTQERGSLFSLLLYVILGMVVTNQALNRMNKEIYQIYAPRIVLSILTIALNIRLYTRELPIKKNLTNI